MRQKSACRPWGTESFVAWLEKRLGRELTPGKRGCRKGQRRK